MRGRSPRERRGIHFRVRRLGCGRSPRWELKADLSIKFECVSKSFGEKKVLCDFSLELPNYGTVALMGPSGCGKTTVLRILGGLEKPDSGVVTYSSNDSNASAKHTNTVHASPSHCPQNAERSLSKAVAYSRLSVVFQEDRLLGSVNAFGNVAAVLGRKNKQAALDWLERMGLREDSSLLPSEMSGGMRRRLAIARAMAYGGDLVLLDEPFVGLDGATRERIYPYVFDDGNESRLTILVTHDRQEAQRHAKRLILVEGPPLVIVEDVLC